MAATRPASPEVRDALSRALVDHGDRLYALALRVTRDPDLAADAVQEAFATALERVGDFRGEASLGTWLHRIVYNKAIDLLRRRGKEAALPDEENIVLGPDDDRLSSSPSWSRPPDEILLGAETVAALERAVQELTPMQRNVFEMREVEGRTTDEVAEILEIPAGTVRVHLHRARLRLRALLSDHFRKAPA
jgi:RNA polymerase sigma-70 factor (ECF subfamily)